MNPERTITVLMPCRDQKREFLMESVGSVLRQTSPDWNLIVIIDASTPAPTRDLLSSFRDERISVIERQRPLLAGALNTGMEAARTEFVCILLSDDRLHPRAIETLNRYRKKFPHTDFFHSSRAFIDAQGKVRSRVFRARKDFDVELFKKQTSPVKHLLCWRRVKGLEIGGMDEELSLCGCDDYDFPWRMAEAGCRFRAVRECLYYLRQHHDFYRLTTDIPVAVQAEVATKMFRKHGMNEEEISRFLDFATTGYMARDKLLSYKEGKHYFIGVSRFREIGADRVEEFAGKGWPRESFFPHRILHFKKGRQEEVAIYPGRSVRPAAAALLSGKWRELRVMDTLLAAGKEGWREMLLNAVLNFAASKRFKSVSAPAGPLAETMKAFAGFRRDGDLLRLDVPANKRKIVAPRKGEEIRERGKTVCLLHAGGTPQLETLLKPLRDARVHATFAFPSFLPDSPRALLEAEGHAVSIYRDGTAQGRGWTAFPSKTPVPWLEAGTVRIPWALDDSALAAGGYEDWEEKILDAVRTRDFNVLLLHERNAESWLPRYAGLIEKIRRSAILKTLDDVFFEVTVCGGH